jgi:hypothetical protein
MSANTESKTATFINGRINGRFAPLGGLQALDLPDGNRVHFKPIDCVIRFGNAGAATRARHLSHWGSNHLALMGISYDRDRAPLARLSTAA